MSIPFISWIGRANRTSRSWLSLCCLILCVAVSARTLAQTADFSIQPNEIDAGGGTTTGGSYALFGAIGQSDAGSLAGGTYSLEGGVVPGLFGTVSIPDGPTLQIISAGSAVTISWTPASPGFVLQESSDLDGIWVNSGSGSQNPVTLPLTSVARFLRLTRP